MVTPVNPPAQTPKYEVGHEVAVWFMRKCRASIVGKYYHVPKSWVLEFTNPKNSAEQVKLIATENEFVPWDQEPPKPLAYYNRREHMEQEREDRSVTQQRAARRMNAEGTELRY